MKEDIFFKFGILGALWNKKNEMKLNWINFLALENYFFFFVMEFVNLLLNELYSPAKIEKMIKIAKYGTKWKI